MSNRNCFVDFKCKNNFLMLYTHMQMHACRIITTSDTVLLEKYTSHFIWKGCVWEGVGDRTELQHIDPHTYGHNCVSFPFSWAAQPRAWGPSLSGCWFSLPHLISNSSDLQTDWISYALSYIIIQRPFSSCWRHNFALIQPVSGQGYNILIFLDRMHLLFTQVHFLFWQPGRVGGQYTTLILSTPRKSKTPGAAESVTALSAGAVEDTDCISAEV